MKFKLEVRRRIYEQIKKLSAKDVNKIEERRVRKTLQSENLLVPPDEVDN